MVKICRFAPSPTGFLHVGNIRAAIVNFLYAKKFGGKFILRLDDTDIERVKEEYRQAIFEDLSWLNLSFDQSYSQLQRLSFYEEAKNVLINSGRLYECYETQEELELQRKIQINAKKPPIYNRASLKLSQSQKDEFKAKGVKPHYRFLLNDAKTSWLDEIKGQITYDGRHFSDPVLIRDNQMPTYTFCSVVDDIAMNITNIIRGEDHITNTAIQIQIFQALNADIPNFAHLALVKASEGKISKREGGFDIRTLRNLGYEPMSIINFLAQIGTSNNVNIDANFDHLINNFSFDKFSKSSTNYSICELENVNHKILQNLANDHLLKSANYHKINLNLLAISILKSNINLITNLKEWEQIINHQFRYNNLPEDCIFLNEIANLLPQELNENSWQKWLENIKNWQEENKNNLNFTHSHRKGKNLFMPIRLALTGLSSGPEMKNLLLLISRQEIIARLTHNC